MVRGKARPLTDGKDGRAIRWRIGADRVERRDFHAATCHCPRACRGGPSADAEAGLGPAARPRRSRAAQPGAGRGRGGEGGAPLGECAPQWPLAQVPAATIGPITPIGGPINIATGSSITPMAARSSKRRSKSLPRLETQAVRGVRHRLVIAAVLRQTTRRKLPSRCRGRLASRRQKMRHLLARLAAAAFVAGLVIGLGPANAAPLPKVDGLASQTAGAELVGYRYHRYGYRPYNRHRYYGYGYRPYYGWYRSLLSDPTTGPTTAVTGGRRHGSDPRIGGISAGPRFRLRTTAHKRVTARLPDMAECARDRIPRSKFGPRARSGARGPVAPRRARRAARAAARGRRRAPARHLDRRRRPSLHGRFRPRAPASAARRARIARRPAGTASTRGSARSGARHGVRAPRADRRDVARRGARRRSDPDPHPHARRARGRRQSRAGLRLARALHLPPRHQPREPLGRPVSHGCVRLSNADVCAAVRPRARGRSRCSSPRPIRDASPIRAARAASTTPASAAAA